MDGWMDQSAHEGLHFINEVPENVFPLWRHILNLFSYYLTHYSSYSLSSLLNWQYELTKQLCNYQCALHRHLLQQHFLYRCLPDSCQLQKISTNVKCLPITVLTPAGVVGIWGHLSIILTKWNCTLFHEKSELVPVTFIYCAVKTILCFYFHCKFLCQVAS